MKVAPWFEEELSVTSSAVLAAREDDDLLFALLTDTHLSDNGPSTRANLSAMDNLLGYAFTAHMGDILCGNIPPAVSRRLMKEEAQAYRLSTRSQTLYIAQGNHDGYRDETLLGQDIQDVALDENWYADLRFILDGKNVHTPVGKPYYYVDLPEHRLRLIFLCTTGYDFNREIKSFKKTYGIGKEQLHWLAETALDCPHGFSVMVFSHIPPFSVATRRDDGSYGISPKHEDGYASAVGLLKAYHSGGAYELDGRRYDYADKDGTLVCWFFGHIHGDSLTVIDGIHYVGVASQTAYVPQLWQPIDHFPSPREADTVSQDAWDSVLWKKKERRLCLFRFGAGQDRSFTY